jgi:hypothetical protein
MSNRPLPMAITAFVGVLAAVTAPLALTSGDERADARPAIYTGPAYGVEPLRVGRGTLEVRVRIDWVRGGARHRVGTRTWRVVPH